MTREIHVWETYEICLRAKETYENPYTDVVVWADLYGPDFHKKVYGFWNGDNEFCIRVTATKPGIWSYYTDSNTEDEGLNGTKGSYIAKPWSEEEKEENPTRRGMIQATPDGHCFQYADGTPYIMVGDTWWALATKHFAWTDGETERKTGPEMTMKDMARIRRRQGYNTVGMIATFPTWATDGKPNHIELGDEKHTYIRSAWTNNGCRPPREGENPLQQAKDMSNEGGRPFELPGIIPGYEDVAPNLNRINPEYFKVLDKKMNWLNANGFTVFIEVTRRDCSTVFKNFYDWPMTYTRLIQYIFARYQTNNILFSPIHFDCVLHSIDAREFNEAINLFIDLYGQPPFGTLMGSNSQPHSLINFGGPDEQKWMTFNQLANYREHDYYWHLIDGFHRSRLPAINGEPYYSGHQSLYLRDDDGNIIGAKPATSPYDEEDHLNCRSGYFGSLVCGAYGGILAGFTAGWSGNSEEACDVKLWEIFDFPAGQQLKNIVPFLMKDGIKYRSLQPDPEILTPNKMGDPMGLRGWCFASATQDRDYILGYMEKDCPKLFVRALHPYDIYKLTWFNPVTGEWIDNEQTELEVGVYGFLSMPRVKENTDWGFCLERVNKEHRLNPPKVFSTVFLAMPDTEKKNLQN